MRGCVRRLEESDRLLTSARPQPEPLSPETAEALLRRALAEARRWPRSGAPRTRSLGYGGAAHRRRRRGSWQSMNGVRVAPAVRNEIARVQAAPGDTADTLGASAGARVR